jgi:YrbI family 3-deoxy-D-manno-octulosonate 8-phosphate phosphatase
VQLRAVELGVDLVRQGVEDKLPAVKQILAERGLKPEQVCYVGDDLPDLPVLQHVGMAVAVADGSEDLHSAAHYVTKANGGRGALREVIEMLLKAQNRWNDLLRKYRG